MANKVSVADAGDTITVNYSGDVIEYKVSGGQVSVEDKHLATFLAAVPGASADAKTTAKAEQLSGGNPAPAKEG